MVAKIPQVTNWSVTPQNGQVGYFALMNTWLFESTTVISSANTSITKMNEAIEYVNNIALNAINAITFDNIAQLKLNSNMGRVDVLGYYTKGDGGGGTFYWDSTSTETDNGGTIIQATEITTGRWKRVYSGAVNVKWFGVTSISDTNGINAVISLFEDVDYFGFNTLKSNKIDTYREDRLYSIRGRKMELIAHRGFKNISCENTMLAFTSAIQNGADSLECDVQVSADGNLILFHDSTVDYLTNGNGNIKDSTLAYLQSLTFDKMVGTVYSDVRIPLFADLLKYASEKGIYIYPEIKGYRTQSDITLIVDAIVDAGMEELCMLQSFTLSDLEYVRNINKKIAIGQLGKGATGLEAKIDHLKFLGNGALLWSYSSLLEYPSIVKYAYDNGVDVGAWAVNTYNDADKLMKINVNKIMSDINVKGVL